IDAAQYNFVSAIAGRTLGNKEKKLSIMAVGDDDQNIYQFRGANVEYIRRFEREYKARCQILRENYRSTKHIISGANQIIALNRDRMKTDLALRIDTARKEDPAGGAWERIDPHAKGRIQIFPVFDKYGQAESLVHELKRRQSLTPLFQFSDCAVIAKEWATLDAVRSVFEKKQIPISLTVTRAQTFPLHRVREVALFLDKLASFKNKIISPSHPYQILSDTQSDLENPWSALIRALLKEWKKVSLSKEIDASLLIDFIYETLEEQTRQRRIGEGISLSTVHSAKGMEFGHVFIVDGGWGNPGDKQRMEEERRLFYVAMTRAKETLTLFWRSDQKNPHIPQLTGDCVFRDSPLFQAPPLSKKETPCRYQTLSLRDVHISFAGRKRPDSKTHEHLSRLTPGSRLYAIYNGKHVILNTQNGNPVARLSATASKTWHFRLNTIEKIRVVAVLRWKKEYVLEKKYRDQILSDTWEIPMVEVECSK
ncbi:MAG: 3'-5' exonuclease, partial [Nitrospinota bacterium]